MNSPSLISPEGMRKLREESDVLYRETRPKLLEEIENKVRDKILSGAVQEPVASGASDKAE